MNQERIREYVSRYLEATGCHVLEHHPAYITVRLSPEADKALMNRPYYWSFIERTGAEPETMTLTLVFDEEQFARLQEQQKRGRTNTAESRGAQTSSGPSEGAGGAGNDSILARYFGFSPAASANRARHEPISFGSARLNQIFAAAKAGGSFVHLYEQPQHNRPAPGRLATYTSYLAVNYKVEYVCDLKRDELYSLGVCLSTGEVIDNFHERTRNLHLSPKLPAHTHINDMLSLPRAVAELELYIERCVKAKDHTWAVEAEQRMYDELDRIRTYYEEMIQNSSDPEEKTNIQQEFRARQDEIAWQHKPRVLVSAVNCGIFHLLTPLQR